MDINKIREFKEFLKSMEEERKEQEERNKVSSHYGITNKAYAQMVGDAIAMILTYPRKSDVLDKMFPTLDAEGRLKVLAFHIAKVLLERGAKG